MRPGRISFPLVINSFGLIAVAVAAGGLYGSTVFQELLAKAFCLGASSSALLGAIALFATFKLAGAGERRYAEEALRDSEERHRSLVENAPVCILQLDLHGRLQSINRYGLEMLGEDDAVSVIGLDYTSVFAPQDEPPVTGALRKATAGLPARVEYTASVLGVRRILSSNFIPLRDSSGEVQNVMGVMQDVTDAADLADKLSFQASYDALTGLVNRREFERRLERVLSTARDDDTSHALCYMDLDQFKIINDTCGHVAGDELLRQLGPLLQAAVRRRDNPGAARRRRVRRADGALLARAGATSGRDLAQHRRGVPLPMRGPQLSYRSQHRGGAHRLA